MSEHKTMNASWSLLQDFELYLVN